MRIWWCQEHECSGVDVSCVYAHWDQAEGLIENPVPCRMVPMRLIPDNGETIHGVVKSVHGLNSYWELTLHSPMQAKLLHEYLLIPALDGETP